MKVDYYFPPGPPDAAVGQAARAARLGFDGFFTAETGHDPFLPLAFAGREAPTLDLGTSIAVAFARSPMVLAHTSWDLAALSGGKFLLGLGTQVRGHITRRFSMPWDSPGPRLAEYIRALRAIWDTWQTGAPLRFQGDFYSFTLMTPFFSPGPIAHPEVPVYIAGVGPYLSRLAGELCQGFHVHPFHTVRYLDEVVLPQMGKGAESAGRSLDDVERAATVFVVAGRHQEELEAARRAVKQQVAFYASTPAYRGVLDLHGWDFGERLTAMSKRGEWQAMADLIPDEVVAEVAVAAPLDELGTALRARYGERLARVGFYNLAEGALDDDGWASLVAATQG
ncbi:MAG: TIGR03617 family F420-dependent LLM class oxidoreductase [Acidimicrobiia bacterium]